MEINEQYTTASEEGRGAFVSLKDKLTIENKKRKWLGDWLPVLAVGAFRKCQGENITDNNTYNKGQSMPQPVAVVEMWAFCSFHPGD